MFSFSEAKAREIANTAVKDQGIQNNPASFELINAIEHQLLARMVQSAYPQIIMAVDGVMSQNTIESSLKSLGYGEQAQTVIKGRINTAIKDTVTELSPDRPR